MALSDNFINELKMKADIGDVISDYVSLKRRGRTLVGLCPFHSEKTASFTVYPESQSFYCFGCRAGGDVIGFVRKIENLDYIDAVKKLAQRTGVQMPDDGYDDTMAKRRRNILAMNREAARFFNNYLNSPEGKVGMDYFLQRGMRPNTIKKFGLGFAPDSWDMLLKYLKEKGFYVSDMEAAGLVKRSQKGTYYDFFRNRVMFPIIDVRGNVIAFGGRVMDNSKPKYINTPDTLVYKKTNELFAMNFAKDSGEEAYIHCEGYMDAISMHQAGFKNAVAGCGTALTAEQVRLLSRYTNEIILAYDMDEAGREAVNSAIELISKAGMKVRIPLLKGGKDPDEIIRNRGRDAFAEMLNTSPNEVEYALLNLRARHDVQTTQGKIDFINDSIRVLAKCRPVEQDIYVSRLAEELGVEKRSIRMQLTDYTRKTAYQSRKKENRNAIQESMRRTRKESYDASSTTAKLRAESRMLGLLMLHTSLGRYLEGFDGACITPGLHKKAYDLLTQRIEQGMEVDLINISSALSQEETDRLSGYLAYASQISNVQEEFRDCLVTIRDEWKKEKLKNADMSTISDEEYRKMFQQDS